jgi:hypothetical protein
MDDSNSYKGLSISVSDTRNLNYYLLCSPSAGLSGSLNASAIGISSMTVASTYDGSSLLAGFKFYINSNLITPSGNLNNLTTTVKSGKPILFGARHNDASKKMFFTGTMQFAAIFPWDLTPQQVQYLNRYVRTGINKS